jgi:hypothetical protein
MSRLPYLLATVVALSLPVQAFAGPVETACNRSDRAQASRSLCNCIGQVADMTLRGGDQKRVASFFKDPDRAQDVKMSKRDSDDAFWERYQAFTTQAEAYCAG